jgi:hypothetical protein
LPDDSAAESGQETQQSSRSPQEQLRIDLLNAFYTAFKNGVGKEDAEQQVEETIEMAAEDAEVDS